MFSSGIKIFGSAPTCVKNVGVLGGFEVKERIAFILRVVSLVLLVITLVLEVKNARTDNKKCDQLVVILLSLIIVLDNIAFRLI